MLPGGSFGRRAAFSQRQRKGSRMISRRTFTASLAAIPASMPSPRPSPTAPASSTIDQLIAAHKAAAEAAETAHAEEGRVYEVFRRTMPRIDVRLPFKVGLLDYAQDHGIAAKDAGEREFATAHRMIEGLEKRGFDKRALAAMRTTCKFRGKSPPDSEMMSPPRSEN